MLEKHLWKSKLAHILKPFFIRFGRIDFLYANSDEVKFTRSESKLFGRPQATAKYMR
jgi:hypothetical protein